MFALSLPSSNNDNNLWNKIINYLISGIPFGVAAPVMVLYIIYTTIPLILKNTSDLNKDLSGYVLIASGIFAAVCIFLICINFKNYLNKIQSQEISREVGEKSSAINEGKKILSDRIRDVLESNRGEKESEDEN